MYTDQAKCMMMENGPSPDFEACFYDGEKKQTASLEGVLCVVGVKLYLGGGGKLRYISSTGETQTLDVNNDTVPDPINHQYQHALKVLLSSLSLVSAALMLFLQCLQNCQQVETAIAAIETPSDDGSYFPVTIRRYAINHTLCTQYFLLFADGLLMLQ